MFIWNDSHCWQLTHTVSSLLLTPIVSSWGLCRLYPLIAWAKLGILYVLNFVLYYQNSIEKHIFHFFQKKNFERGVNLSISVDIMHRVNIGFVHFGGHYAHRVQTNKAWMSIWVDIMHWKALLFSIFEKSNFLHKMNKAKWKIH